MSDPEQPPPSELTWSPAKPGGAAFVTHRLRRVSDSRVEFHPSGFTRGLLVVLGLGSVASLAVGGGFYVTRDDDAALFVGIIMALLFALLTVIIARVQINQRVFDRVRGRYWSTAEGGSLREPGERSLPLDQIVGLQIVGEMVDTPDTSFYAEELNLVLESGERECVVDYDNPERLREDARALAHWLGVPLWEEERTKATKGH